MVNALGVVFGVCVLVLVLPWRLQGVTVRRQCWNVKVQSGGYFRRARRHRPAA